MSPSSAAILAIDQGTSGTKAIVVDPVEGVVGFAEVSVRPTYLAAGGVEQNPEELLNSVLVAGKGALAAAKRPVGVVALANQGETVLAWDRKTGTPLSPAIVWQDRRAETIVSELADSKEWVAQRTGLVLDAYFSAPKMAWIRRHMTTDGVVTTTDTWLVHHLCGEFVTDVATASRSLLVDLDSGTWDPQLVRLFGWQREPLPRIVACDEPVGHTTAFGSEMVVAGLMVDQQAALLAEGCVERGAAKCTFGTGAFLLANLGPAAVRSRSGLTTSVAWRARGQLSYCLDGQVYTAASAVRWLIDLGLIERVEQLDEKSSTKMDSTLCVPALAGLAAPWWRSDATAALTGMTLATGPGEIILAVLQGIAAQVVELTTLIDADIGFPMGRLCVDGGLTKCRTLMQSTADQLQIPVEVYPFEHATALGVAAAAQLAMSPHLSISEAMPAWTPSRTYEPLWSSDEAGEFRQRWRQTVSSALASSTKGRR